MASQEQEHAAALEEVIRQYQELGRLLPQQQAAVDAAATGIPNFNKGLAVGGKAAMEMGKAFTSAMGAMYKGEKGLKAFDSSIDHTAQALMVLAGAVALAGGPFTLLAAGLTAAVAGVAKYTKAANEQSDKLYNAFQQMSRSGGAAADGLQGLYNDVQKLGGGIEDLGDFVELIASSSGDLASFKGNVFEGRKEFAKLGKEMEPFREGLMNAGMTQKEINQASMGYLRLQSRIGQTQNKTVGELAESTRKYLVEQDALTKLTGMNRKEQEDQREAIRSQEVFAGKLLQLRNRNMGDAAKELEDTFLVLNKDSKDVGQGFADISSGNLRTEAAQKLYRATQGEARRVAEELSDGQITAAQAADRISKALGRNIEMYGESQTVLGNYNNTFGDFAGQQVIANRQLTGGYEKQLEIIRKNNVAQGIFGNALDKELQRQTDLRLTEQKAMQNMQDFTRYGVEPATRATAFFGKVIERITNLLPGSGKFAKEYEQEKKDKQALLDKEKALQDSAKEVMDAQGKVETSITEKELEAAQKELDAAKTKFETAHKEKQALLKEIEDRKAGKTTKPSEPAAPPKREGGPSMYASKEELAKYREKLAKEKGEKVPAAGAEPKPGEPVTGAVPTTDVAKSDRERAEKEAQEATEKARQSRSKEDRIAAAAAQKTAQQARAREASAAKQAGTKVTGQPVTPSAPSSGPVTPPEPPKPAGGGDTGTVSSPQQAGPPPAAAAAGTEVKPGTISKVIESSVQGGLVAETTDGQKQRRMGIPAFRHNNPGNLRLTSWTKSQGGVVGEGDAGTSGKFAVFDSLESGRKAKENLLFSGRTVYANLDLRQAMYKYAPPQDKNNTESYLQKIVQAVGAPDTTKLAELSQSQRDAMLAQIEKVEGFKVGKVYAAADGGIVQEKLGGTYVLAGEAGQDEAVIPLKNGAVPVAMPKDFVESMSKYQAIMDMLGNKNGLEDVATNISQTFAKELENIKNNAISAAGPNADAMLQAFKDMTEELRRQGDANKSLFESMLREQEESNDISSKILQASM